MTSLSVEAKPQDTQRPRVWRVEVHPRRAEDDPQGHSLLQEVREMQLAQNLREVRTCQVYLLQTTLDQQAVERIAGELLCDPIHQRYRLGATPRDDQAQMVEVHRLPGVMDPVARSAGGAITEMTGAAATCAVRTGARYDLFGASEAEADQIARRLLANTVIESVSNLPEWPQQFTQGRPYEFRRVSVPIRDLDADALANLSRDGHLFLSPVEMKAIQDHFLAAGREPTDIELETLAQTWSEHCVHKTLKSTVRYRQAEGAGPSAAPGPSDWSQRPGHRLTDDGSVVIENLLKSTIAAATHQLIEQGADWCISVFVDNAGIVAFDDEHAITFKVETHNHPSAIEPYGGAATGAGGCIRDTMGTGLCAKPIANTDVFAVADPSLAVGDLPRGVLHPRRILKQVVAGVRDYGNRMGIPTLNGAVWFDDRYLGNPLVFCGSVGLIPRDKCFGDANPGDRIVVIGGRTGRDGIHGATFSSAELTDTHADEFSHAVQIGDPITEKKALDVILAARDRPGGPLFSAITDCGAGGFSSAVGEMGEKLGAEVQLDQAPLKYEGLSYTEIWISEAQERMVLAVPPRNVPELLALCASEDVEACDLGHFGTERQELVLRYQEQEVGRLSMKFVHEGLPQPTREAHWEPAPPAAAPSPPQTRTDSDNLAELLGALLAHPNIASKHWIIRQYDHEVQGGSVLKPLTGAEGDGPGDAAVIRPKLGSSRGIALSCGLATDLGDIDPYWMVLAAVDEAVRNAVCVGARPDRIAILDNFCWPGCDDPQQMASLVRAAEACYDAAMAYRTPFISGKDSLNNQFTTEDGQVIAIPATMLISAVGRVDDTGACVSMDAKAAGNLLIQVGETSPALGGSHLLRLRGQSDAQIPRVDLATAPARLAAVSQLIRGGHVRAAHDCSEGGMLVAAAEMAFAGGLGVEIDLEGIPRRRPLSAEAACFAETPTRILLEIEPDRFDQVAGQLRQANVPFGQVGLFTDESRLTVRSDEDGQLAEAATADLKRAWLGTLDW